MAMSLELAWAAGLFDGEGSVGACNRTIQASVHMTDPECLRRFLLAVGAGKIEPWEKQRQNWKPQRRWRALGKDAISVMEKLSPWLGSVKLADFEIAKQRSPRAGTGKGSMQRDKTHCKNGHEFNTANTSLRPYKDHMLRQCRPCHNRPRDT